MEKKQINPGSESLRMVVKEDDEEEKEEGEEEEEVCVQRLFIIFGFICRLRLWSRCLCGAATQPRLLQLLHPQQSLHLHLNNKLKAAKFRHCDYQCNYIIELKTELASCTGRKKKKKKTCYQKMQALTSRHVLPQCARRLLGCLDFKISVQY